MCVYVFSNRLRNRVKIPATPSRLVPTGYSFSSKLERKSFLIGHVNRPAERAMNSALRCVGIAVIRGKQT